jgi:hypothetical protein
MIRRVAGVDASHRRLARAASIGRAISVWPVRRTTWCAALAVLAAPTAAPGPLAA